MAGVRERGYDGSLAPVAAAGWSVDDDPVVGLPLLARSASALAVAGVRYLFASGLLRVAGSARYANA